jgi:hypothetical protein
MLLEKQPAGNFLSGGARCVYCQTEETVREVT